MNKAYSAIRDLQTALGVVIMNYSREMEVDAATSMECAQTILKATKILEMRGDDTSGWLIAGICAMLDHFLDDPEETGYQVFYAILDMVNEHI